MSAPYIFLIVIAGVTMLLLMVLKFKLNAFISLLITSIFVGILAGMPLSKISESIQEGMGGTLGFIATVVGLGAIFGQMLESSGGARSLSKYLLGKFGKERAPWATMLTGLMIGIPIFLDVGLIILIPVVYALTRETKRSLLYFGIPLLAGLAVGHAMIPPTPGPVAVSNILNVDLGWVILFGLITGIPAAITAGVIFGNYISKKIDIPAPEDIIKPEDENEKTVHKTPPHTIIALLILFPLLLILMGTFVKVMADNGTISANTLTDILIFIGHPFTALIIATFLSILLCLRMKMTGQSILDLSTKALGPAGIIILVTGAGGVLKQILVDSGIGVILAESIAGSPIPVVFLAWALAALVRITQGSATVAMITAAGIMAPVLPVLNLSQPDTAIIVVSIASGATILSHVNDSGFWIVNKYLGMTEKQTLQSWTVMETIISVVGLGVSFLLSIIVK